MVGSSSSPLLFFSFLLFCLLISFCFAVRTPSSWLVFFIHIKKKKEKKYHTICFRSLFGSWSSSRVSFFFLFLGIGTGTPADQMGGLCGLEKQACTSWPPWWHACCFLRLGSVSLIFNNVFFLKSFFYTWLNTPITMFKKPH